MEVLINDSQIGIQTNLESEQYDIDNSSGQLFNVLSELYSRPVDSCIREICTNCNDAHIMSKKEEKPFIIVLPNPNKKLFNLSIRDFGPGLNEVTISKIFTYGGSSKRDDVDSTGCLGLGAKSPYAITDTFYVKSFCDGKLTQYICFKDENNRPNKSKDPVELDTLEENGLEIVIPIWDEYDYISILKRELKYFKVKPLVYIDEGNGERSQITIDWEKDTRIQFTENVYVLPEVIKNPIPFFKDQINKNPLVEQLQIWYPLESSVIMTAIDRYNLKKMYPDGSINEKYKISETRKTLINLLLNSGVKIKAVNQVMFSPSRESIKYTERTLEYIISNLNRAAKLIEKNIISKINSIKNLDDYFDNCVLKQSLYGLLLEKFSGNISSRVSKFENDLNVTENLYGMVNIKNQNHYRTSGFYKNTLIDIYNDGISCHNIGYSGFDPHSTGILFEWQTKEYQIENLKVLKEVLLELYKKSIINHLEILKEDIQRIGIEEVCNLRDIKLTDLIREKISILQYIKNKGILNEYKLLKNFIKSPSTESFVRTFNKNVFDVEFGEDLKYLQHIIIGYEYLKVGKIYLHFPINSIIFYYKTLQKLYPKIGKAGLPEFEMLDFINNLKNPKIIKRSDRPFEIKENHLSELFKSCKSSFTYTNKNMSLHASRTYYIAYFLSYYSMLRNPHLKNQLELQNTDLKEYNDLIINQLPLPKKVRYKINTKNYFVAKNVRAARNIPKLETPWILVEFDERKFKSIIKQLNYKIEFLQNIYEKINLENLSLDLNFSNLYKKNPKMKLNINLDDYKNIFLPDTSEIPEEILVKEYTGYISKLLSYYFTLHYATLKLRDELYNKNTYINKNSIQVNDKLKSTSFVHNKNTYYSYSDFIYLNKNLYTIIKPEKIVVNNLEIDVVNSDLDESLFNDIKCNYINELNSIIFTNTYQYNNNYASSSNITNFNIFNKDYGYTLGGHLMALSKMDLPQKFGKLYLEFDSQITKEELLKNFEYLSSRFNLVSYKNTRGVMTKGRFLNFIENEKSIFGLYPKTKTIENSTLNVLVDRFKETKFIKKENYLFLPNGSPEYNKVIPKKNIIDKLEVLFKHFQDIHEILRTKKYFYTEGHTIETFVFTLQQKYSRSSNYKSMFDVFLSNGDNEFILNLYNDLNSSNSVFEFFHFYNIYKFIHSKESDFNFDGLIKTFAKKFSNPWEPEVNEFYPKIRTEVFNKLKKLSHIYWNTYNKLDPDIMKELNLAIKEFDKAIKDENIEGAIKSITDNDLFSKLKDMEHRLIDIFEIYSQNTFVNNFEFLQILNSENIETLVSDYSLLDQNTKNSIKKLINDSYTFSLESTLMSEVERKVHRMQDRIVNIEKNSNQIILTFSKFLHLENFKSISDFSPLTNDTKKSLLDSIKLFLDKNLGIADKIRRKIFGKHKIILNSVPNYFINKWSYLDLDDKEFKRYVINQKINRKGEK